MNATIMLICTQCAKKFLRKAALVKSDLRRGRKNTFCSVECCAKYSKKLKILLCQNCNISYSPKWANSKFCNQSCAAKFNNRKRAQIKVLKIKPIKIVKIKTIMADQTLAGLRVKYSLNQYHAKIRGWSRSIYTNSGKPMKCLYCQYSLHVDICHIKNVSSFNVATKISIVNDITNLIALCKNHHWEFDNERLSLEQILLVTGEGLEPSRHTAGAYEAPEIPISHNPQY